MFWTTLVRVVVGLICLTSIVMMLIKYRRQNDSYNVKTRDYWYGRMMWTISGLSAMIEGIVRGSSFRFSIVFIAAAAVATLKANLQSGRWGTDVDNFRTPKSND